MPTQRRSALRRAVHLEAHVLCDAWDGPVEHLATNLSEQGIWLSSQLPLEVGEEVLLTLMPPRWRGSAPLTTLGKVARVGLNRRRRDRHQAGMGIRFVDLGDDQSGLLRRALQGLPPPLPKLTASLPAGVEGSHVDPAELELSFTAEAPLLTAGGRPELRLRRVRAAVAPLAKEPSPQGRDAQSCKAEGIATRGGAQVIALRPLRAAG